MEKTCGNCGNPCGRENCGFWEPNNEVLEQRYKQLAEVAKSMFKHLCSVCDGGDVYNEDIADFRDGLEKLGVEV